jgi:hypothetical protein
MSLGQEKTSFDGEIVVVTDDQFTVQHRFPLLAFSYHDAEMAVLSSLSVARSLSLRAELEDIRRGKAEYDCRQTISLQQKSRYLDRSLSVSPTREIMQTIWEGRMRVAFLINSPGGDVEPLDVYRDMLDYLQRKGGTSSAYATDLAGSAAFDLLGDVDHACVLDRSILAWHRTLDMETDEVVQATKNLDLIQLGDVLNRARGLERRRLFRKVKKALADKDNPDGLVVFSGKELVQAGCLTESFAQVEDLRKHFSQRFWGASNDRVRQFWKKRLG